MILFNITIKAELAIYRELVDYLKSQVALAMPGCQLPSRVYRLMNVDTTDGITYCLQHYFEDLAAFNAYKVQGEMSFREELSVRFGDKLIVFSSVLSEV
jgi:hypothetical protein